MQEDMVERLIKICLTRKPGCYAYGSFCGYYSLQLLKNSEHITIKDHDISLIIGFWVTKGGSKLSASYSQREAHGPGYQ